MVWFLFFILLRSVFCEDFLFLLGFYNSKNYFFLVKFIKEWYVSCVIIVSMCSLENNVILKMVDKLVVLIVLLVFGSFGLIFFDKVLDL